MCCLRKMSYILWKERVTNDEVLCLLGTPRKLLNKTGKCRYRVPWSHKKKKKVTLWQRQSNERLMEKDQEEDQETSGLEISKSGLRRRPMDAPETLRIATCGVSLRSCRPIQRNTNVFLYKLRVWFPVESHFSFFLFFRFSW